MGVGAGVGSRGLKKSRLTHMNRLLTCQETKQKHKQSAADLTMFVFECLNFTGEKKC